MTADRKELSMDLCQFCAEAGVTHEADTAIIYDNQSIPLCDNCADHTYLDIPPDWTLNES